mmetsp:Transcript_11095/g.68292  ORF Transcript_11095/g.68292 Transcript_11095/m.68292 type:complete len:114 (-) Transcript_11095:997-1338(-)
MVIKLASEEHNWQERHRCCIIKVVYNDSTSTKLHVPQCDAWNSFINWASLSTPDMGMALYTEARIPPTERCPFNWIRPFFWHRPKNSFSSSGVSIVNGTFMALRTFSATGDLK